MKTRTSSNWDKGQMASKRTINGLPEIYDHQDQHHSDFSARPTQLPGRTVR